MISCNGVAAYPPPAVYHFSGASILDLNLDGEQTYNIDMLGSGKFASFDLLNDVLHPALRTEVGFDGCDSFRRSYVVEQFGC